MLFRLPRSNMLECSSQVLNGRHANLESLRFDIAEGISVGPNGGQTNRRCLLLDECQRQSKFLDGCQADFFGLVSDILQSTAVLLHCGQTKLWI